MRTPHLLFVVNSLPFFLSHRLVIARRAIALGYQVSVLSPKHETQCCLKTYGIVSFTCPIHRTSINPLRELKVLWALARCIRRVQPSVLHAVTIKPVIYTGLIAFFLKKPVVLAVTGLGRLFHENNMIYSALRWLLLPVYRLIGLNKKACFIFQNLQDQACIQRLASLDAKQMHVLHGSGVDLEQFSVEPFEKGRVTVAFIARLVNAKGIHLFLKAAEKLSDRCKFLVAGEWDRLSKDAISEAQMTQATKAGYVHFLGYCKDVRLVIAQAHIVCLPTLMGEGLPKVLAEAASMGRPMLASNVAGCDQVVQDGKTGFLFEKGNLEHLMEKIIWLLNHPSRRIEMGKNARKMAETRFDVNAIVDQHILIYERLLSIKT